MLAAVIFLFPIFLFATSWLIVVTDLEVIKNHGLILLFLALLVIVIDQNSYTILIRINQDFHIPLTGTLSSIILYASMFVWGPTVFWIAWISGLFEAGKQQYQNQSQGLSLPAWLPLNAIVQNSGVTILQLLIAALVFQTLGGSYPLSNLIRADLQPAIVTIIISFFLPIVIFLPLLLVINQLTSNIIAPASLIGLIGAIVAMTLVVDPFSIPLALSFTMMGTWSFVVFCLGVFLAQMLAANLSRSNLRHQQRNRELAVLEKLGKEIIESSVDGSQLEQLLSRQLESLFARARTMIHLFPPASEEEKQERPYFTLTYPAELQVEETHWQNLQQTSEDYLVLPKQKLPQGKQYFGDLFLVKITVPNEKGTPHCVGGIYVHQPRSLRSAEERLPTILELAGQIGAALYRAQVHAETLAYHKVTQELEFAGHIQASFLPKHIPQIDNWDITARIIPARQTSGDFYDFVDLKNGRIGVVVADVADKGTGAALYMALSRTLIRTYAMQYPDHPGKALQAANERILNDTESDQFVTVFLAVLDPQSGQLTYANAGHNPPIIAGSQHAQLTKTGIPLGMFEEMRWESETIQLYTGDTLTMFTDGIPEAQNEQDEEFGDDRLINVLQLNLDHSAQDIVDNLVTAVQEFTGDAPQFDDITLVVLQKPSIIMAETT